MFGLALAATVAFHVAASASLSRARSSNRRLENAITDLKKEVGDYDIIKAQREELLRQRVAIEHLDRARVGPVYVLRELSNILTPGKGPTFDHSQYDETVKRDPHAGLDPAWEPKRVWVLSYAENDRAVTIHMGGKSDEDVAEFTKRLKLSAFFSDVYWQQTQPQIDPKQNVTYVTFDVFAE